MFDGPPSGMFAKRGGPPFSLTTLQADPNCVLIQDPSAVWGVQDFLPRRNLLLSTDTLATQNVTVVATAYKIYMQGTGSITLSGTGSGTLNGTGANERVSLSFTPTAGTLTLTVSGTVTHGMLCLADTIDQSYQKITNWTTEQYAWAAQKQVPWLRRNTLTYTATISNAVWALVSGGTGVTPVVTDGQADPLGGFTASRIVLDIASGTSGLDFSGFYRASNITIAAGTTTTIQCWVKSATGSTYTVCLRNPGIGLGIRTINSSWSLITYTGTAAGVSHNLNIMLYGSQACSKYADFYVYCPQLTISGDATGDQPIGASWDATYTANAIAAGYPISLWQDSAGTTAVNGDNQPIGKMLNYKLNGLYDATQATTANQPKWRLDANGKPYIERDLVNDALPITLPNLGSNCSIYIGEGPTVTESTGQTLNGSYAPITPAKDYGRVIFQAPTSKSAKVIKWLLAKAGH